VALNSGAEEAAKEVAKAKGEYYFNEQGPQGEHEAWNAEQRWPESVEEHWNIERGREDLANELADGRHQSTWGIRQTGQGM